MYEIVKKRELAQGINEYVIAAPMVAKNAKAGQFVILMTDEKGERAPFTLADIEEGEITILVQTAGKTTYKLAEMKEGENLYALVGPLGNATDLSEYKEVLLVGGGIGSAVIYPQAKARKREGKGADVVIGARNKELIIYEEEFKKVSEQFVIMTDDGSYGEKGFVTEAVKKMMDRKKYDAVFAVGPLMMMKAVCKLTKEYGIKTIVSMNSIMVDGTGMCGGCRLTVDGKTKYACVDGPEFDGHLVDFDEAINRSKIYKEDEHSCYMKYLEVANEG
ncbi:MAG: sulfide/dihydroorotate dehydrogenase-like FAD/NAD-binding protein [Clostridia bacterium]